MEQYAIRVFEDSIKKFSPKIQRGMLIAVHPCRTREYELGYILAADEDSITYVSIAGERVIHAKDIWVYMLDHGHMEGLSSVQVMKYSEELFWPDR